ncbi:non-ribosomal peptide synthetase [Pseudomonas asplenii]|nr:non-ribosomal peptide synthetase [Pseudomonas fuscovaginae]
MKSEQKKSEPHAQLDIDTSALSYGQKRMWFLHLMDPSSAAYNIFSIAKLHGHVNVDALRAALQALIKKHPSLRTSFHANDNGKPESVIHETVDADLTVLDNPEAPEQCLDSFIWQPFDLGCAPLLKAVVIRTDDETCLMALVIHHIVADGWSLGILHKDLQRFYAAALTSQALPTNGYIDFSSFVAAEKAWIASEAGIGSRHFWKTQLHDLAQIELPMANPRPAIANFRGKHIDLTLPLGLVQSLEALAKQYDSSLYMVLGAALKVLLHRYSGQTDIVFGTPVANRPVEELENVLGLFVNTVVLRTRIPSQASFTTILKAFRDTTLLALEHQRMPFEQVVEDLNPERSLSHNPLFQVLFTLQNVEAGKVELEGTRTELLKIDLDVARVDLEWTLWRRPTDARLRINYALDLFDEQVIREMASHYECLLNCIVQTPQQDISQLPLFLNLSSAKGTPDEQPWPDCGLHGLFLKAAQISPNAGAVSDKRGLLTFDQLSRQSAALAVQLVQSGVHQSDTVAICVERSVDIAVATLAVLRAGAAFVPINPADPEDRRAFITSDSNARAIIVSCADKGCDTIPSIVIGKNHEQPTPEQLRTIDAKVVPGSPCYILYTSGTTGRPKGVMVSHGNIVNTMRACQLLHECSPSDVGLVLAASTFDVFYFELFIAMLAGGQSRIVTQEEIFSPQAINELLKTATIFQAVPGLMENLLTSMSQSTSRIHESLRVVITGGDVVPADLLSTLSHAFPRAKVFVAYGPTEATIFSTLYLYDAQHPVTGYPIGQPLEGVEVVIADKHGNVLPDDVTGEIWIGGRGVATGYINREAETCASFIEFSGRKFYRSGDRGRWNRALRTFEFRGRLDSQVKVRGFRIELGEVEAVLTSLPSVHNAVVLAVGEPGSNCRLVACVTAHDNHLEQEQDNFDADVVAHWRTLFDQTHEISAPGTRDFTGWNSSYDQQPIAPSIMNEWLDGTVENILRCITEKRSTLPNVLEVGVGTGLLAQELAPHCARYVGTDFSTSVILKLRQKLRLSRLTNIELSVAEARNLPADDTLFDVIVVNSVSQYFPDITYLTEVLDTLLGRLAPDGVIYLGDVRNYCLLETFHASVQSARAPQLTNEELLSRIAKAIQDEPELNINPRFFNNYSKRTGLMLRIEPRRGRHATEMNKYRYDVTLRRPKVMCNDDLPALNWQEWRAENWTFEKLAEHLCLKADTTFAFTGVPHGLLIEDLRRRDELYSTDTPSTLPDGVIPEALRELSAECGYNVSFNYSDHPDGYFDMVLSTSAHPDNLFATLAGRSFRPEQSADGNNPGARLKKVQLSNLIKEALSRRLPNYMLPSVVTVLDTLPITNNGKIDRKRIPTVFSTITDSRPPSSPSELLIARIWQDVLAYKVEAVADDFFEVGGTSLLAIAITVQLRQAGISLMPQVVFEHRTVELLARWIDTVQPHHEQPQTIINEVPAAAEPEIDFTRIDASLDTWRDCRQVLLTGATGMLGVHILHELLCIYPQLEIVCLVRAQNDQAAQDRLASQYAWYFPQSEIDASVFSRRVRCIRGDLRERNLGIGKRTHSALIATCDRVIHAAADVRHVGSERDFFAVNTDGTERVIELCSQLVKPSLCHISTIGVAGRSLDGVARSINEYQLEVGQTPTEAYSASKIFAEHLIADFNKSGDYATVFRVGTVSPNSVSGKFQRNIDAHFFSRYVRAVMGLGVAADWTERRIQLIPADTMAQAVLLLSGQPLAAGRTFHIQTPNALPYGEFIRILNELGYGIDLVSAQEFEETLPILGRDKARMEDVGRILPMTYRGAGRPVALKHAVTDAWLDKLGFQYFKPTKSWIENFVAHGVEQGFFPPADGFR